MFHFCTSKNKLFLGVFLSFLLVLTPSTVFCKNKILSCFSFLGKRESVLRSRPTLVSAIHNDDQDDEKKEVKERVTDNTTAINNDQIIIPELPDEENVYVSREHLNFYSDIFTSYILTYLSPVDIRNTLESFHGTTTIHEDFQEYFLSLAQNFSQKSPELFLAMDALKTFDDFYKSQKAMAVVQLYTTHFPNDKVRFCSTYKQFIMRSLKKSSQVVRILNRLAAHPDVIPNDIDYHERTQNFELVCEATTFFALYQTEQNLNEWLFFLFRDTKCKNITITLSAKSLSTKFIKSMLKSLSESGCAESLIIRDEADRKKYTEINTYILSTAYEGLQKSLHNIETRFLDILDLYNYLKLFPKLEELKLYHANFEQPLELTGEQSDLFTLKILDIAFSSISVEFLWSLVDNLHRFPHLKEFKGNLDCNFHDAHIPALLALKQHRPNMQLDCFYDATEDGLKQVVKVFSELGYNQYLYTECFKADYDFVKTYNKEYVRRKRIKLLKFTRQHPQVL